MIIPQCPVSYSSIVEIAELVQKIEMETDRRFLKLHRGVIDVTTIDLDWVKAHIDLNTKTVQHYAPNDGDKNLLETIKETFHLQNHQVLVTPGGMAGLDLIIASMGDELFHVPEYHWGSWSKILTINNKKFKTFNDFNLSDFNPTEGTVMLCYPGNPTGYQASVNDVVDFIKKCKKNNVNVILDFPYFYLLNDFSVSLEEMLLDNVILCCSFSKSVGLSGFRIGFVATKNPDLYKHLRIRSLYKYNSISTVSQQIIHVLLTKETEKINQYRVETLHHIKANIDVLIRKNLLFGKYPSPPVGPFAIINRDYDSLFSLDISSVPLQKFTLSATEADKKCSRISVAVNMDIFRKGIEKI